MLLKDKEGTINEMWTSRCKTVDERIVGKRSTKARKKIFYQSDILHRVEIIPSKFVNWIQTRLFQYWWWQWFIQWLSENNKTKVNKFKKALECMKNGRSTYQSSVKVIKMHSATDINNLLLRKVKCLILDEK